MITLYQMDVIKALKQMPDESVDMQITSPPYWGLRDYGVEGQIGLEPDFNDYIKRMCDIFDEVKRVLKKDGTCWVNLGDTYASSPSGLTDKKAEEWDKKGDGMFGRLHNLHTADRTQKPTPKQLSGIQPKCLTMIPERFALEMINRGWILRNKIIWHKPNHMPTSVKDRFANSWEYLFMFSKSRKYYFDLDEVREPHKIHSVERACRGRGEDNKSMRLGQYAVRYSEEYKGYEDMQGKLERGELRAVHPKGKNPDDIINSKYEGTRGHSNRQGFQRETSFKEKRVHQIIQLQIAEYLRKYITKIQKPILDEKFGKHTWTHWIRTDESGASLPSPKDWIKLKEILKFNDRFDKIMTETEVYLDDGLMWKNKPKNPSDFWNITTQPYKEAHFAVFPEKLVERPIKTTKKKAVILDIFAGSGTTLKVARDLHRDSIGIEIKKEYCDLIYKRLFGENQTQLVKSFKLIK